MEVADNHPVHNVLKIAAFAIAALLAVELACLAGCCIFEYYRSTASAILEVQPALGDEFNSVQQAAVAHASDAKLLRISTEEPLTETGTCSWDYLFVSRQKATSFIVRATEEDLQTIPYSPASLTREGMEAIASPEDIMIDAHEAYRIVTEQLSHGEQYLSCNVALALYNDVTNDEPASKPAWVITFNDAEEGEGGSALPPFEYRVDAQTGTISKAV